MMYSNTALPRCSCAGTAWRLPWTELHHWALPLMPCGALPASRASCKHGALQHHHHVFATTARKRLRTGLFPCMPMPQDPHNDAHMLGSQALTWRLVCRHVREAAEAGQPARLAACLIEPVIQVRPLPLDALQTACWLAHGLLKTANSKLACRRPIEGWRRGLEAWCSRTLRSSGLSCRPAALEGCPSSTMR